jgi:hypothetical protein
MAYAYCHASLTGRLRRWLLAGNLMLCGRGASHAKMAETEIISVKPVFEFRLISVTGYFRFARFRFRLRLRCQKFNGYFRFSVTVTVSVTSPDYSCTKLNNNRENTAVMFTINPVLHTPDCTPLFCLVHSFTVYNTRIYSHTCTASATRLHDDDARSCDCSLAPLHYTTSPSFFW